MNTFVYTIDVHSKEGKYIKLCFTFVKDTMHTCVRTTSNSKEQISSSSLSAISHLAAPFHDKYHPSLLSVSFNFSQYWTWPLRQS